MNELIKLSESKIGNDLIQTVNARDLWTWLESKQQFGNWIQGRIKTYEFVQGIDYIVNKVINEQNQVVTIDYFLTIRMAKDVIVKLAEKLNMSKGHIYKTTRGERGYFQKWK